MRIDQDTGLPSLIPDRQAATCRLLIDGEVTVTEGN